MSHHWKLVSGLLAGLVVMFSEVHPLAAHARFERSEPPAGSMVETTPVVLKAWFSQELMSRSRIVVLDSTGVQVDLGDGRVDLDDADRKVMLVTVPELPSGVYTVAWTSVSAEDGDDETGTFVIGIGVTPNAGEISPLDTGAWLVSPNETTGVEHHEN